MPLSEPVPDLGALDLLVSVGQMGSISAASAVHGITQPAASMRLRHLERTLGVKLMERSHQGTRLTPAGHATIEWAGRILQSVLAMQKGIAALRDSQASRLCLAASLTVADYLLPAWLQRLGEVAPEISVSLQMGNTLHVADLVDSGQVELGFIEGTRPAGRFRSRDICSDRLLVVVGRGHPWARRRTPVTAEVLARSALIVREPGSGTRDVLSAALTAHQCTFTPSMELGSTVAIKAAAVSGAGPAVLSRLAVEAELHSGSLVSVPYRDLALERTIRAIWPVGRDVSEAGRKLLSVAR